MGGASAQFGERLCAAQEKLTQASNVLRQDLNLPCRAVLCSAVLSCTVRANTAVAALFLLRVLLCCAVQYVRGETRNDSIDYESS